MFHLAENKRIVYSMINSLEQFLKYFWYGCHFFTNNLNIQINKINELEEITCLLLAFDFELLRSTFRITMNI